MKIVCLVGASFILSIVNTVSANQPRSSCVPSDVGLSFEQATLEYNNLGGVGPGNEATPEEMRFNNIGQFHGRTLDFVATIKEGEEYEAANTASNGLRCKPDNPGCTTGAYFAQINMLRNRNTTVVFEIQDQATGDPVVLPGFVFSVYDIDEGVKEHYVMKGWSSAQYEIDNPEAYFTESSGLCDGVQETCLYAHSTHRGHGCDNPTDPMDLGIVNCKRNHIVDQRARSFQVTFQDTSSFELFFWYEATEGDNGRNVVISFNSAHSRSCETEKDFFLLCEEEI